LTKQTNFAILIVLK